MFWKVPWGSTAVYSTAGLPSFSSPCLRPLTHLSLVAKRLGKTNYDASTTQDMPDMLKLSVKLLNLGAHKHTWFSEIFSALGKNRAPISTGRSPTEVERFSGYKTNRIQYVHKATYNANPSGKRVHHINITEYAIQIFPARLVSKVPLALINSAIPSPLSFK